MLEHAPRSAQPTELLEIIAEVRRRWRFKLALRGMVRVVIVAMLLILAATYGIEWARSRRAAAVLSIKASKARPGVSWRGRQAASG